MVVRLTLLLAFCTLLSCGSDNGSKKTNTPKLTDEYGVTDYNPDNDPRPLGELIQIDGIAPGARLSSPFTLTGKADASWYFEGDFPVKLVDANGNTLSSTFAKRQVYDIEKGFVPFRADLLYIAAPNQPATLILSLDNPSETEGYHRSIEIPVILK